MSNLIKNELDKIISIGESKEVNLSKEDAFDFLIASIYCYNSLNYDKNWHDILEQNITDGSNDGGIDFVFYVDDNSKVIVAQNKYSTNEDC